MNTGRQYTRWVYAAVVTVGLGIGAPARALDPMTYPQSPSDRPKNQQPLNLFSVWNPALSSGEFVTGLDISVPPARNGLEPVFGIRYRSNRRGTMLGKGWELEIPVIRRSTRHGVPGYVGPGGASGEDVFEFELGEHGGELRFVALEGNRALYQARREGIFARFYWEADGTWTVLDRDGRAFRMTQKDSNPDNAQEVFAWHVATITDVYGNQVLYQYAPASHGVVRVTTIVYDLHETHPTTGSPHVVFTWGTNSAAERITYEKGYRSELNRFYLSQVKVQAYNEDRSVSRDRTYDLAYAVVPEGQSVLSSIHPADQPTTSFQYHAPPQNLTQTFNMSVAPWDGTTGSARLEYMKEERLYQEYDTRRYTQVTLADVDGDGDLDYLRVHKAPGSSVWKWQLRKNNSGILTASWADITIPQYTFVVSALRYEKQLSSGQTYRYQDLLHVDNDGKIDFVSYDLTTHVVHICYGNGLGQFNCTQTIGSAIADQWRVGTSHPTVSLGGTCDRSGFIDVNGDGLLDYVRPPPTAIKDRLDVYYNTGTGFSTTARPLNVGMGSADPHNACIRETYPGIDYHTYLITDLRDFNADGIPDRVELIPSDTGIGTLQVFWGDGRGNFDSLNGLAVVGMPALSNVRRIPVVAGGDSIEWSGYYDVNGDRLPDAVYWVEGAGYFVHINKGNSFGTYRAWNLPNLSSNCGYMAGTRYTDRNCPTCSSDPEQPVDADVFVRQMLVDFDGDGQLDLLSSAIQESQSLWCGATTDPTPVYRLRQITHGNRASTSVSYGFPAQETNTLPFRFWGLSTIEQQDVGTQRVGSKEYQLFDPLYDFTSREFRGYLKTRVTDKAGTTALRHVDHIFRQDEWGFGKTTLVQTRDVDPEQSVLKDVATTYDPPQIFPGAGGDRAWVRPASETVTLHYDTGTTATQTAFHYFTEGNLNKLGLLQSREYRGYTDVGNDSRFDVYEYYVRDDATRRLVRKKRETRQGNLGITVTQVDYLYDGMCELPGSALTGGKLCRKTVYRDTSLEPAVHGYAFDTYGRLQTETSPDGESTTLTYHDSSLQLTPYVQTSANALGHTTSYSEYDPLSGEAGRTCGPQYAVTPGDKCDELSFDKYGRVIQRRIALDNGFGNYSAYPVETLLYADDGIPAFVQSIVDPDPVAHQTPVRVSRVYHDIFGSVVLEGKQLGATWANSYFAYNALGKLSSVWIVREAPSSTYQLPTVAADYTYQHDLLDRLTDVLHRDGDHKVAQYHPKQVAVIDGEQKETTYGMTAYGEVGSKTQYVGYPVVHTFLYDGAGRLTTAQGPNGSQYDYLHHGDGSLAQVWSIDIGLTNFQRTPGGKLDQMIRPNGSQISFDYDLAGRTTQRHLSPDGTCPDEAGRRDEFFTYDATSRTLGLLHRVEATGPDYNKVYDYDARGRVTDVVLEDTQEGQTLSYARQYTATGETLWIDYPSGRHLDFGYNTTGQPIGFTDHQLMAGEASYHPDGQLATTSISMLQQPMSLERSFQLDGKRRVEHLDTTVNPGNTTWNVDYSYYANDNLKTYDDPTSNLHYLWTYDGANRLSGATGYGGTVAYTYNNNGSLTGADEPGGNWWYVYATSHKVRLTSMASVGAAYNFSHDTAGQRCTMTGTAVSRAYQWTADGNLARMSDSGNQPFTTTFAYDHAGQRWRRLHGETFTWYLDDMVELSNDQGLVEYAPLPGARCEVAENSEVKCHLKDQLSSVMTVDGDGAVLNKSTYLPYGKRVLLQGSTPGVFGFNDKREENKGDLVYYGARYYDPVVRQFISPDPLRFQGAEDVLEGNSLQPYVYAGANPTTFADDGRMICSGSQCPDSWTATLSISTMGVGGLLSAAGAGISALATTVGSEVSTGASATLVAWRGLPLATKIAIEMALTHTLDAEIQSYLAAKKNGELESGGDADKRKPRVRINLLPSGQATPDEGHAGSEGSELDPLAPAGPSGHTTNARGSTAGKHERADTRRLMDRGREKGDQRRRFPRRKPDGWRKKWPPDDK